MVNPSSMNNNAGDQIYKNRYVCDDFDIIDFSYNYLLTKTNNGFLRNADVYKYLGRRFSLKKPFCKKILTAIQERGLLRKVKRGVILLDLGDNYG